MRCASLRCTAEHEPGGSVAGFTGYRLCRRPHILVVLLYCVVLCCRRDGLGSICMRRNGTNGTREPAETNGTAKPRNQRNNATKGASGPTEPNGTTETKGNQELKGTTETNGTTEPNGIISENPRRQCFQILIVSTILRFQYF